MEEVKSRAKWWNNEVVVPNLRTSLCMLSGEYQSQYQPQGRDHHPCPICNHRGLQEEKNIHSCPL